MRTQYGMGLVEVMVSLLLLAIAVLGFSALQMNAVKATDESLLRGDSMSEMRNLSEDLRLNPDNKSTYLTNLSGVWDGLSGANKNLAGFCEGVAGFKSDKSITATSCDLNNACGTTEQADYNSFKVMQAMCDASMMINAVNCPGMTGSASKLCMIVSWNDTYPEMSAESSACANAAGAYRRGSNCLIMETY